MLKVDIKAGYAGADVIDAAFSLERSSFTALLGANGSGKSTLLHALCGFLKVKGSVELSGREISRMRPHRIAGMGLILLPEDKGLFSAMSVLEHLQLGHLTRAKKDRTKTFAEKLSLCFDLMPALAQKSKNPAGHLSGGEQQMLALSRCVMAEPSVLLVDEPSLGLAPQAAAMIYKLLKTLSSLGPAVLLAEQNAKSALSICEDAMVLESGKIALRGKSSKLSCDSSLLKIYLGGEV